MSRRGALLVSGFLLGALGCSNDDTNPFQEQTRTALPRASDTLIFTSSDYGEPGPKPREVFSVGAGNAPQRLTTCNNNSRICDHVEAAPSPDGTRLAVRRVSGDTNGDGLITDADAASLLLIDLNRSIEGELVPEGRAVSGVDWSPVDNILVYTAASSQGNEDLFSILPNGQDDKPVMATTDVKEKRPRFDPTGFTAIYGGIDNAGKGRIYALNFPASNVITTGGPGSEPLAGTPYVVGSDADPAYSPDGQKVVFRRLVGTGNGGFGVWDIHVVNYDGSNPQTLATGPVFRGAPDWGPLGIAFVEIDAPAGRASLVVVQPDGSGRSEIVSASSLLSNPRWLR